MAYMKEILAERPGFEPGEAGNHLNGLASRRFRPLSHLSDLEAAADVSDR